MTSYIAPLTDMNFTLASVQPLWENQPDADELPTQAVLQEAARLAEEVIAPLNHSGDIHPSTLDSGGAVTTSPGWKEAFQGMAEGGWIGVATDPKFGGLGMPHTLSTPVAEIWQSANMSFSLCALLTQSLIDAIEFAGTDKQKNHYLPNLVSGLWTGTMNLTESHAGTDLGAIRTRAVRNGDTYLITGQKIFITYGEHDLSENIVHLVLARIEGAPEGSKGISAFLVPKYKISSEGKSGERNDVWCTGLEKKLGIRASPTATMVYGDNVGAEGYLLGRENRGLEIMFIMMNRARFEVGLQGVAIAERAFQQARQYAQERVQGEPIPLEAEDDSQSPAPAHTIVGHPDVKRSLVAMKAKIAATRALAYYYANLVDLGTEDSRKQVELLTPIVKGWITEVAVGVTSEALQIFGGMGFVEETGAAQHYRDARILTIYEGTSAIQANDLVFRKIRMDQAQAINSLMKQVEQDTAALRQVMAGDAINDLATSAGASKQAISCIYDELSLLADRVTDANQRLRQLVDQVLIGSSSRRTVAAAAFDTMMAVGWMCGGWQMLRQASAACNNQQSGTFSPTYRWSRVCLAAKYAVQIMPEILSRFQAAGYTHGLDYYQDKDL